MSEVKASKFFRRMLIMWLSLVVLVPGFICARELYWESDVAKQNQLWDKSTGHWQEGYDYRNFNRKWDIIMAVNRVLFFALLFQTLAMVPIVGMRSTKNPLFFLLALGFLALAVFLALLWAVGSAVGGARMVG